MSENSDENNNKSDNRYQNYEVINSYNELSNKVDMIKYPYHTMMMPVII